MSPGASTTIAGRIVVVTGGARGIGLAIANALHRQGARVAIGDLDDVIAKEAGRDTCLEIADALDVTSEESFVTFLDRVERELGPIDVLVNNAGLMHSGPFLDEPLLFTKRMIDVNVYGVLLGSRLAAERMTPRGSGHIINIASLAARSVAPYLSTYCATKHAVLAFTESFRRELRGTGVTLSTVMPTFTNTELAAGFDGHPLLPNAEPSDVAAAVCALITTPRTRVAVTRWAGAVVGTLGALPNQLNEFLLNRFGFERLFVEGVDPVALAAYEQRVRNELGKDDE